jgi:hypothetical protein
VTSVRLPTRNGKGRTRDQGNASHIDTSVHLLDTHLEQPAQSLDIRATEITMVHSDSRDHTHKRTPGRNPPNSH